MSNDILNAAQGLNLEPVDTETVIKYIARDILLTLRGSNKISPARLEQAYRSWYPDGIWDIDAPKEKILSTMLLGPPGHGKTTTFKEAARRVSTALGMRFVLNPGDEEKIGDNDFLFVSQEFSAENSKMELGGIPAKRKEPDSEIEYMVKLTNRRIAMLSKAGGGLLLLDDFPNASPNIQNIGLSLTDEKRFQGLNLDFTYVALTGNLGSVDGTNTGRLSTALRGRCETYFVADNAPNFISRARTIYRDEIGDAGASLFLDRHPDSFAQMPNIKHSGGFAAPRNWDHAIIKVRQHIRDVGGRANTMKAMPDIRRCLNSLLGKEVGEKYYSFMYAMMRSADPLAREVIYTGKLDSDLLKKRFGDGLAGDQQHFAFQYASALVDYSTNKIATELADGKKSQDEVLKTYITRFALGVLPLHDDSFAFAINGLSQKLAVLVPSLATKGAAHPDLTTDAKVKISKIIAEDKQFNKAHASAMIDALSNADKYETRAKTRRRTAP